MQFQRVFLGLIRVWEALCWTYMVQGLDSGVFGLVLDLGFWGWGMETYGSEFGASGLGGRACQPRQVRWFGSDSSGVHGKP